MVSACIQTSGTSRSFGPQDEFLQRHDDHGEVLVLLGERHGEALAAIDLSAFCAVLVELDGECLGAVTGEDFGREGGKVLGFARYRIGDAEMTQTIELVVQPQTAADAKEAARAVFEEAGFKVAECNDAAGRILDRLMRPYFNLALNALDDGVADADALDSAVTRGLGYHRGPIAVLAAGGLAYHHDVTARLHAALGEACYQPPRRAQVAASRQKSQGL